MVDSHDRLANCSIADPHNDEIQFSFSTVKKFQETCIRFNRGYANCDTGCADCNSRVKDL